MEHRKLTKEDIDKVRNIEGFPIAKDEDIIALSDAPYYTACPNPFIEEFIEENGTPYDELTDNYQRKPFAADVSEGKTDPVYLAHTYHTKVPHKAIMKYILHYTNPGDIVLDGFCGTGMTGVAANACGSQDHLLEHEMLMAVPEGKWGARKAIISDLSPAATFISANCNTSVDVFNFAKEAERIISEVEKECGWLYKTDDTSSKQGSFFNKEGVINYVIWSDVFICPHCGSEVIFWNQAVDQKAGKVLDDFCCPECGLKLNKLAKGCQQ